MKNSLTGPKPKWAGRTPLTRPASLSSASAKTRMACLQAIIMMLSWIATGTQLPVAVATAVVAAVSALVAGNASKDAPSSFVATMVVKMINLFLANTGNSEPTTKAASDEATSAANAIAWRVKRLFVKASRAVFKQPSAAPCCSRAAANSDTDNEAAPPDKSTIRRLLQSALGSLGLIDCVCSTAANLLDSIKAQVTFNSSCAQIRRGRQVLGSLQSQVKSIHAVLEAALANAPKRRHSKGVGATRAAAELTTTGILSGVMERLSDLATGANMFMPVNRPTANCGDIAMLFFGDAGHTTTVDDALSLVNSWVAELTVLHNSPSCPKRLRLEIAKVLSNLVPELLSMVESAQKDIQETRAWEATLLAPFNADSLVATLTAIAATLLPGATPTGTACNTPKPCKPKSSLRNSTGESSSESDGDDSLMSVRASGAGSGSESDESDASSTCSRSRLHAKLRGMRASRARKSGCGGGSAGANASEGDDGTAAADDATAAAMPFAGQRRKAGRAAVTEGPSSPAVDGNLRLKAVASGLTGSKARLLRSTSSGVHTPCTPAGMEEQAHTTTPKPWLARGDGAGSSDDAMAADGAAEVEVSETAAADDTAAAPPVAPVVPEAGTSAGPQAAAPEAAGPGMNGPCFAPPHPFMPPPHPFMPPPFMVPMPPGPPFMGPCVDGLFMGPPPPHGFLAPMGPMPPCAFPPGALMPAPGPYAPMGPVPPPCGFPPMGPVPGGFAQPPAAAPPANPAPPAPSPLAPYAEVVRSICNGVDPFMAAFAAKDKKAAAAHLNAMLAPWRKQMQGNLREALQSAPGDAASVAAAAKRFGAPLAIELAHGLIIGLLFKPSYLFPVVCVVTARADGGAYDAAALVSVLAPLRLAPTTASQAPPAPALAAQIAASVLRPQAPDAATLAVDEAHSHLGWGAMRHMYCLMAARPGADGPCGGLMAARATVLEAVAEALAATTDVPIPDWEQGAEWTACEGAVRMGMGCMRLRTRDPVALLIVEEVRCCAAAVNANAWGPGAVGSTQVPGSLDAAMAAARAQQAALLAGRCEAAVWHGLCSASQQQCGALQQAYTAALQAHVASNDAHAAASQAQKTELQNMTAAFVAEKEANAVKQATIGALKLGLLAAQDGLHSTVVHLADWWEKREQHRERRAAASGAAAAAAAQEGGDGGSGGAAAMPEGAMPGWLKELPREMQHLAVAVMREVRHRTLVNPGPSAHVVEEITAEQQQSQQREVQQPAPAVIVLPIEQPPAVAAAAADEAAAVDEPLGVEALPLVLVLPPVVVAEPAEVAAEARPEEALPAAEAAAPMAVADTTAASAVLPLETTIEQDVAPAGDEVSPLAESDSGEEAAVVEETAVAVEEAEAVEEVSEEEVAEAPAAAETAAPGSGAPAPAVPQTRRRRHGRTLRWGLAAAVAGLGVVRVLCARRK